MAKEFAIGDKVTHYDVSVDEFRSREIIFIRDGWALLQREGQPPDRCPRVVTSIAGAAHTSDHPIQVGSAVQSTSGHKGTVIAIDGSAAWVRPEGDPVGGIIALSALMAIQPT